MSSSRRISRRDALGAGAALGAVLLGRDREVPTAIELWLGGDVELQDDATPRLDHIAPLVAGAIGIVNLEGPVVDAGAGAKVWNAPAALASLHAAGVRVAGIANNHAADRGPEGIAATRAAVREARLLAAGASAGPALIAVRPRPIVVTAHDLGAGVPADLEADLASSRPPGAILVCTFHVTGPPSYLPRPELRAAAEMALAAGADIIAAHGTHALAPVERRGRAVIAWGLGNLLFTCPCTDEIDGAILRVSIPADPAAPVRASIIPIDAGLRGEPARAAHDPALIFELFSALGSTALTPLPLASAAAF